MAQIAQGRRGSRRAGFGRRLGFSCRYMLIRNAARLEQVLSNLMDNAIKYGREGGRVTVSARALAGDQVEVAVQDDGPGLPPEALERIFERFYRVDKARSRDQGGTGLGLAIVKHIVQSHGGRVWAKSELGQGTAVVFTLPAGTPVNSHTTR